jgi:hypothetical protein
MEQPTVLLFQRVFVAAGMFLPSRCLAMNGGIYFIEPLSSSDRRDTHAGTQTWEGFMKYAVEMDPVAMIYIPSFIKIGSSIPKLIRGIHRQDGDRISLL